MVVAHTLRKERRIDENQGISILRHRREVAFGNLYPMVPSQESTSIGGGAAK